MMFSFTLGFTRPEVLQMHIKRVHEKSLRYDCKLCGDSFAWPETLKHHMKASHNDGKKEFKCDKCPYETKTSICLYQHKTRMHKEHKEPFSCPFEGCTAMYTNLGSFMQHKRVHRKDPEKFPHVCVYCGWRFKTLTYKLLHEKRTHVENTSIQCPMCAETLVNKIALSSHLSSLHPEYDGFFCTICDAKFYSQKQLDIHVNKEHTYHSTECDICDKVFKTKRLLNHHKSRYHGIQPFNARPKSRFKKAKSKSENSVKGKIKRDNAVEHDEPKTNAIRPFRVINGVLD